jgi:uncharacterized protein YjbI with pentapeptide repeats
VEHKKEARKPWTLREYGGKPVWDWLHLIALAFIPIVLALVAFWFTAQQNARLQQIEDQRAENERELEEQRAQDAALQAYLDQMSTLLTEKDLRNSEEDSAVRALARARTATVMQRLDAEGNRNVVRFLSEAGLTGVGQSSLSLLAEVDLRGVDLSWVDLSGVNLSGVELRGAKLVRTELVEADLSDADLIDADLSGADLSGADLSGAVLWRAELSGAYLRGADLVETDLPDVDLSEADLSGADVSQEQLEDAASLEGATMPDGSKHP